MNERAAPLVLVVAPGQGQADFGSYASLAETGQRLLAAELSQRIGRLGATVVPLVPQPALAAEPFHWGRWFTSAARQAVADAGPAGRRLRALGYAGAGALALLGDGDLEDLLAPNPAEVLSNNRFSADAFIFAAGEHAHAPDGTVRHGISLDRGLERLEACPTDNTAVRFLETAGFAWRHMADRPWSRFDVDTPIDLALLRLSTRLPGMRAIDLSVTGFLEMARLPGGGELQVPNFERLGEVIRDQAGQLVVAGRVPASVLAEMETQAACRVRAFVEERGMRSARDIGPRSFLARWMEEHSPGSLIEELSRLGDAVILDTRVLMASLSGSSATDAWPPDEERFASDFMDAGDIRTPWLRDLVEAARAAPVPFIFGDHALISDGLRLLVAAAWLGR
jgi:hypothetical protein